MARIRGLELQFNLVKGQFRSQQDCAVVVLHALLINSGLQCVGTGEGFSDSEHGSELLPDNWNANQEVYTLRYVGGHAKKRYLVKIVKAGSVLHFNIANASGEEDSAAATAVNISKHVNPDYGNYDSAYKEGSLEGLKDAFRKDIVQTLLSPPSKGPDSGSPTTSQSPRNRPAGVPPPPPNPAADFYSDPFGGGQGGTPYPFPSIGGSDLDPLGRGMGGGMIMDPAGFGVPRGHMPPLGGRGGLPRGAVPPGARFDPFGPPFRGPNRRGPDRDYFQPPDFDDFM